MTPRKLKIGIVGFPYAGNGGTQSQHPSVGDFVLRTVLAAKADPRCEDKVAQTNFADTPITMTRNLAIAWAKKAGVDVLVMVDSDQEPDMYLRCDPKAKPFFESSFDFLYEHYEQGPVTVFAPYCGPPGHPTQGGYENVYVFKWQNFHSGRETDEFQMDQYSRAEAAQFTGIKEAAAGPTGLCMIDMRCFDYMTHPYFYYQYKHDGELCALCGQNGPGPQEEKASTEDVTFFRDLSLSVVDALGYNPVFCNWDSWAGHWKPWCVGKPTDMTAANVSGKLRRAYERSPGNKKQVHELKLDPNLDTSSAPVVSEDLKKWLEANGNKIPEPSEMDRALRNGDGAAPLPPAQPRIPAIHASEESLTEPQFSPWANMEEPDRQYLASLVDRFAKIKGINDKLLRIVEIGSWAGRSAEVMASAAEPFTRFELHCVDHFQGAVEWHRKVAKAHDVEAEFRKNTERFGPSVVLHRADSKRAAIEWSQREDTAIDLLFIDADHSYESCRDDIAAWAPFVVPGGIICGHDYTCQFPGVKRAVHEAFGYDVFVGRGLTIWSVVMGNDGRPHALLDQEGANGAPVLNGSQDQG